ncbi:hypothetical protein [Aquipseudomonas alcaligenes]|uniref:Uncharacterized protein n=1 Tax=Aquipseudomonas alcaligenes TaxID=43263 RepID=A0A1N6X7K7_AQUAC|nr:hypothetical protein [Pseudomonas alcaligenes]SIQ98334.1 hypothetical protein SAMN05878282_1127 [Pseudomonas alcaligenes]
MKNEADYLAGWTGKIFNPESGKWSSGGAARARRIALAGGVGAVEARAFTAGIQFVQPVMEQMQAQLDRATKALEILIADNPKLAKRLNS